MIKRRFIIGLISLLIGVAFYYDQELRLHATWSWEQFTHHEPLISIAGSVGVVLVLVAIVDYVTKKSRGQ